MSENSEGHSWGGARGYYAKLFVVAFMVTIYSGLPGTNSRSINSVDPMYESETCKVVNSSCETHYNIEFRTNPGLHLFQFSDLLLLILSSQMLQLLVLLAMVSTVNHQQKSTAFLCGQRPMEIVSIQSLDINTIILLSEKNERSRTSNLDIFISNTLS